ncbi:hypothetical protein STXM2123_862 [Streptomyces sp. F-3]|nr:hypothetical protein STXM2123_862 [Streptomyces sp. F-3]
MRAAASDIGTSEAGASGDEGAEGEEGAEGVEGAEGAEEPGWDPGAVLQGF